MNQTPEEVLSEAIKLAKLAHTNHFDKSGAPYINHLERVAARVAPDPVAEAVAWLHDLVEDRPQFATALGQFPAHIVRAVYLLTKSKGEDPALYFARIKTDPVALKVKLIGDIPDNLSEDRLGRLDQETQDRLRKKYAVATEYLTTFDDAWKSAAIEMFRTLECERTVRLKFSQSAIERIERLARGVA